MLAEELVEGLSEQGLDSPALGGAQHAQLAVDGLGKVAGDLDAAGTAVPGGLAGNGDSASSRAREGYFCIRHSDLPGSRADTLAACVLRWRRPQTVSARACLPAGLSERSFALPPSDFLVNSGFSRLALGVVGATCLGCHDCCGLLACHALETLLGRGLVSDWDDLSATDAGTVPRRLGNGPFGYPAIPLVAGLLFALDRWMARRPGASPGAADARLRAVGWFRGWDVERGGVSRPKVLASRMPRA